MPRLPAAVAALTIAALLMPAAAHAGAVTVANAGFEEAAGQRPPSWQESGALDASFVEAGGSDGTNRLTHWSATDYRVTTSQRVTGLRPGTYTLRASVRSSGGQRVARLTLTGCGGADADVDLPRTGPEWWVRVAVSVRVTRGACTIGVRSDASGGQWSNVDGVSFERGGTGGLPIRGADVSHLSKNEDHGAVYRDASGRRVDPLRLLHANGVNYARLKVWVDPADGYNAKPDVLRKALRAKASGMKLLIDFHYSDAWADPGKQNKPAAWAALPFDRLAQAVYDHTFDVLSALRAQGTPADLVQVGNEINGGMLWSEGSTDNWGQLAGLLNSGYDAVKAVNSSTPVALHLAKGGDLAGTRWWFDSAVSNGVKFDAIGLSYYGYWHGTLADFQTTLDDAASRYGKPVFVAETAYPFRLDSDDAHENIIDLPGELVSGYPATAAGQLAWMNSVANIVEAVPNGRGLGVFYWEATWTAVDGNGWDPADAASGNGWENQALFGYDDKALSSMSWFSHR